MAVRVKGSARKQVVQAAFSDGLLWVGFRQPANGFLFFNYFCLLLFIQALRLVALSLALSHGREDRVAVGIKGFARKSDRAGCFSFLPPRSAIIRPMPPVPAV